MNKQIEELERQAFDAVWDLDKDLIGPGMHFRPNGFEKKFAELIVRECCKMMIALEPEYPGNLTVQEIKKHFGVK